MEDIEKYFNLIDREKGLHQILFVGKDGEEYLEKMHNFYVENFSSEKNKSLFMEKEPGNGKEFWREILEKVGNYDKGLLENNETYLQLSREFLIDKFKQEDIFFDLFISNLDKVFYKLDIEQKGKTHNAYLRTIADETGLKFRVHGSSIGGSSSKEYIQTLGNPFFPFYSGNFFKPFMEEEPDEGMKEGIRSKYQIIRGS